MAMASSSSSSSLSIITFFLLIPLCLSRSHHKIPNETLDLSLLWYGQFTPLQKQRVHGFIDSLNFDAKDGLDPKVSSWWKVVESYQERYEMKVTPRIKVKIVRSYVDEKMKFGKELTIEKSEKLIETTVENRSKVVPVLLLSPQVRAIGVGFCNETCQYYSLPAKGKTERALYMMVSDPEAQCPGECAWPFHKPKKGPRGMIYQPPSGEIGADALIIQLATSLANFVTNPDIIEFLFKYKSPSEQKNQISSNYVVDPATKCIRVFGFGAFPGFTGKIRVDLISGGAFNSHGINNQKFLTPSIWNPKTKSCWTPM